MVVLDTNVLVYAANAASPEHASCRDVVERCRRGPEPWYLSWSIVYEFLRVVTHPRVFAQPWSAPSAWEFVRALLASSRLQILAEGDGHAAAFERLLTEVPDVRGNLLHDAHTAALMVEHGIRRIYTRDTDFARFPFIEVLDPLRD